LGFVVGKLRLVAILDFVVFFLLMPATSVGASPISRSVMQVATTLRERPESFALKETNVIFFGRVRKKIDGHGTKESGFEKPKNIYFFECPPETISATCISLLHRVSFSDVASLFRIQKRRHFGAKNERNLPSVALWANLN